MMDADNPTAPDAAGPAPSGPERRKSVRRIADTEDYPGEPKRFRTRRAADRAAREQILMTPEKALHVLRLMVGSAEMYGKARDAGRHTPAHLIPDPVQGGKILAKVIPPLAALRDELVALRASLASRPAPGEADLAGMDALDMLLIDFSDAASAYERCVHPASTECEHLQARRAARAAILAAFAQVAREREELEDHWEAERGSAARWKEEYEKVWREKQQAESALATAQAETAALREDLNAMAKLCEMALDGQNIRARFAAIREKLSRPATEEGTP
jgi:hypothetical protein